MSDNPFSLDGEIAFIAGGGSGLGFAASKCMAAAGARVVIAGKRESLLQEAVSEIGEGASYELFDAAESSKASETIARVAQRLGSPTILVNAMEFPYSDKIDDLTDEAFSQIVDRHAKGSFALARSAAPAMLERGRGSIVFITPMATPIEYPQAIAYSAAKSAIGGLVRLLTTEFAPHGVRVNAISPGVISNGGESQSFDGDPLLLQKVLDRTPMAKMGEPEDIGRVAVFLCSQAAKYVTGLVLPVDGGTSIGF